MVIIDKNLFLKENHIKTIKCLLTMMLVLATFLTLLAGFTVAALELNEDIITDNSPNEEELLPLMSTPCFASLAEACNMYLGDWRIYSSSKIVGTGQSEGYYIYYNADEKTATAYCGSNGHTRFRFGELGFERPVKCSKS